MATSSSLVNEDKNNNRYDPSKMYNIGQTPLARLRPEKYDDKDIKTQISIVQQTCGEIDPDIIALVLYECENNIQKTISRIKSCDFEDGGWRTAKSNNKKKNNNLPDQVLNGGAQSDNERTSPVPALHGAGGQRRQDHYQYSSSSRRRGNDSGRNPSNPRYPSREYSNIKSTVIPVQPNPSETKQSQLNEEITPPTTTSSTTDEYEFIPGTTQSLTFDNSLKKTPTKRVIPSSIPQQPVSMHRTVQFPTQPIDIQFGDIQWNDSVPIPVSPSNNLAVVKPKNDQEISPITTVHGHEQHSDVQNNLTSIYNNHQTTSEIDMQLLETTNRLATTNNNIPNDLSAVPLEGTSHLSDHLTGLSQGQVTSSSSSLTDTIRLPPTSTPHALEYTSPTSQIHNPFIPNSLEQSLSNASNGAGGNVSAFTPYNTPGTYQAMQRDYSQPAQSWNQQPSNYKTSAKPTMIQTGNYPQQSPYQLPPQQQFILGTYPYHTPTLYQVFTPVDPWSAAGYTSSLEPYSTYPPANYLPTYPTQAQYHPAIKYDQYPYDKESFIHYGQTRLSNNELPTPSQQTKDPLSTSKLSATAATFPHGASPATAYYINSVPYTLPAYYTSHQDRTMSYPSVDNRNGASYGGGGGNNNRNYYQQRTHNNSTWHSQQQ